MPIDKDNAVLYNKLVNKKAKQKSKTAVSGKVGLVTDIIRTDKRRAH